MRRLFWRAALALLIVCPFLFFLYLSKGKHNFSTPDIWPSATISFVPEYRLLHPIDTAGSLLSITELSCQPNSKMRTAYEKLVIGKRNKLHFSTYFRYTNPTDTVQVRNWMERIIIPLERWDLSFYQADNWSKLFTHYEKLYISRYGRGLSQRCFLYFLLDTEGQLRGVYDFSDLNLLMDDVRILQKKLVL